MTLSINRAEIWTVIWSISLEKLKVDCSEKQNYQGSQA